MATVTFEVISSNRDVLADESTREFDVAGGTIGRAFDNDWVLPDPMRYISSKHARISFEGGTFYLEDISKNGVLVEDDRPIGRGGRVDLSTIERVRMGDYLMTVSLSADTTDLNSQTLVGEAPSEEEFALTSGFEFDLPDTQSSDDFLGNGDDMGLGDLDLDDSDPLAIPDDGLLLPDTPTLEISDSQPHEGIPSLEDAMFLSDDQHADKQAPLPTVDAATEKGGFIPENWDLTGINPKVVIDKSPAPEPAEPSKPAIPSIEIPPKAVEATEAPPKPAAEAAPTPAPIPTPQPIPAPAAEATPTPGPTPPPTPAVPAAQGEVAAPGNKAAQAFAEAGIDAALLSDPEFMDQWAAMLPTVLGGLLELLQSRATIKNEMRASKTTLQPVENNPLKFSLNAPDAVHNLFVSPRAGFLPADQAISDAMADLKLHQVALINGVQGGLGALVGKLSPQAIETLAEQGQVKKNLLGKITGANLWEAYKQTYANILENSTDSFLDVFAEDFVKAYEGHILQHKKR